jgi:hypothetical protein
MNAPNPHSPSWNLKIWLPLLLAVAYGIFARLYNLGRWELTIDEYYLVKSIESILENGLPSFGCGGYYERGLLQQYLTAPLIAYFDNTAFAARIPPALANILAIPVMFKLAEKVSQSRVIAAVVTGLFALSLWEIEFARFARMYSFFQLVFILQLYWLVEIIIEDRIDRYKYLLATTALGIFIYQGVIFSLVLCTLPIILRTNRIKLAHLVGLAIATVLIAIRTKIHFRNLFAEPRYPAEYTSGSSGKLPIYIPEFMLVDATAAWVLMATVIAGIILGLLVLQTRKQHFNIWQGVVMAAIFICAALHQFALALMLAIISTCFGIFKDRGWYFLRLCLWIVVPLGIFWLLLGIIGLELGIPDTIRQMIRYPSVYWNVLVPFFVAVPRDSLIFFPILLLGAVWLVLKTTASGKISAPSLLLGVSLMLLVAQSAFITPQNPTRYSFFLYPCLLLLFVYFCVRLPTVFQLPSRLQQSLSIGLILTFVLVSENYNPRHLLNVSSAEYNFRKPYQLYLQFHFYQRYSYADVAEFVNNNLEDGDQVIATTPVIDYYLDQLDFSYRDITTRWFQETSACSGTRHIWSHSPLIYAQEHLLEQVANGQRNTWIITGENGKGFQGPEDKFISSHYQQYLTFTGQDSQLKVYKIPAGR